MPYLELLFHGQTNIAKRNVPFFYDRNVMMPFGNVVLLTSVPGSGFSISPLIFRKMSKILGILFRNEIRMEKINKNVGISFL